VSHRKKRLKKTEVRSNQSSRIKRTEIEIPLGSSFSFKYFQADHDKFSIREQDGKYLQALLKRLRELSKLTVKEIVNDHSKSIRCHPIVWEETTEDSFGIPNEEQLVDTPYQLFEISLSQGRAHGFFIENIAYIVWLDPEHKLYQKKK
jgi:hypothetical protein